MKPAVIAALALLAGCAASTNVPPPAASSPPTVAAWVTSGDRSQLLAPAAAGSPSPGTVPLVITPATRYQEMIGFGAALTDASAWLMTNRLTPAAREALLRDLFGPDGANFRFTRLTIGASDFSRQHYSYDDMPAGASDPTLSRFSIDANRADVLPVMKQALAIQPGLTVMASPWSAPGWMKTSDSLIKGSLKPEHYDSFARYLVRYLDAFAAEGVPISAITVQNEPHFEPQDYPGMRINAPDRARLIGEHIGPLLAARSPAVRIYDWDHNWNEPESPLTVLADARAARYVTGVAWHCYAGAVEAQARVRDAYPDKEVLFTECSGGEWAPDWADALLWNTRQLVVGASRNWARGVLMWNLALDEKYGPHLGGCGDCRGVVTINSSSGAVTRNAEYYALAHASRFLQAGARRVASSGGPFEQASVAFRNPDGSLVLVVVNVDSRAQALAVREGGRDFGFTVPARSVATLRWQEAP
ncbi:glycoside hydrolase family 30 beta sandwich domain-containing protein [Massilia sp. TS11]|uniref:glycoside hydrolase family 30 protein n=1 Tax=Massilia sp. TS11 TaxID=2908003 RepID=UPI001EDBF318|nr:glycoside hydrolase family 30 beta sandwich domain-containing protein [Massilia sp. TS11]MCG2586763.1 glycosyl hydrolase [Massilia sp. TS11]